MCGTLFRMEKSEDCEAVMRGENKPDGEIAYVAMCGLCEAFQFIGQLRGDTTREDAITKLRDDHCPREETAEE